MAQRNYGKRSAQDLLQDVLDMEVDDDESSEDENDEYSDDSENIVSDLEDLSINNSESELGDDNEYESESENDNNEWRQVTDTDFTLDTVDFSVRNTGVQIPPANIPNTVTGMFQLYFTDELIQNFVDETNRYARTKIAALGVLKPRSIWRKWSDVTMMEMKCYIGIILKMSITSACDMKDYFSTRWDNYIPFFTDVIRRDRFLMIHWMLHVEADNPGMQRQTRGMKIRNMVTHMKSKCTELFIPKQNIAVDETTIKFKGRVGFLMYNPQKPTKWGLRVFSLCDSETGYLVQFEPYYGQTTSNALPNPNLPIPLLQLPFWKS